MLRADYRLFEYNSIPEVPRRAPVKYYRAFLHPETDDNDLTCFLLPKSATLIRTASFPPPTGLPCHKGRRGSKATPKQGERRTLRCPSAHACRIRSARSGGSHQPHRH
jgi:hypothetical protein